MRIFEEYLKRHNIDVPIVHHCNVGTLILKADGFEWMVMEIRWISHDYHPGQYSIEINTPIHDGYINDCVFTKNSPVYKKWDEYENFLLGTSVYNKFKPVSDPKEIIMTVWEMFVYSCDSWFAKKDSVVKQLLFESLDKDNSIDLRYKKHKEVLSHVDYSLINRIWTYEMLAKTQNYAFWLSTALNKIVS